MINEEGVEDQFLRHDAQLAARIRKIGLHIAALHQHTPARGACQSSQNADHRGLSRTIGAEKTKEFTFLDIQAYGIECLKIPLRGTVGLGD